jgi:N-acetylneuraminic acid mutarotase
MKKQRTTIIIRNLRWGAVFFLLLSVTLQLIPSAFGHKQNEGDAPVDPNPPSNCVWTSAATIPIPIMDEAAVTLGNNIYTFGGLSEGFGVSNAYKFDGTTWTPITPYPWECGVEWPSAVTDGDFIYIMNGTKFCPAVYSTDLFRYDPKSDIYTQLASNSVGTWNQTAVYLNGKIYKMGGRSAAGYEATLEIYDIATNTWSPGAPLPQPAGFAASWAQNDSIYIAGGVTESGTYTDKTYRYDVASDSWEDGAIADLPENRWGGSDHRLCR